MMKFIVSGMALFFSSQVFAADFALELGFRQQSGSVAEGKSAKSQSGYQLGATGVFPFTEALGLRTGFMYVNRPLVVEDDTTGDSNKIQMNYFEVPLAINYKFEDYASVFGGISISMFLDSSADERGSISDEATLMPLVVGASFKFAPQLGGSVFFESASGKVADGLENYRAVGANLTISFE